MVLQGYDSLGLEKIPKYWCRTVQIGYLLVHFSRADSICFASLLIFLPGLEGPQRTWKGLMCLYPLNTDIPRMICLKFPRHCREVTPKHPACTLNIFCLGKKRERHHWWQWFQFQVLPWCPGVRYGICALLVIRQHLVESWDSFFFLQPSQVGIRAWISHWIPSSPSRQLHSGICHASG